MEGCSTVMDDRSADCADRGFRNATPTLRLVGDFSDCAQKRKSTLPLKPFRPRVGWKLRIWSPDSLKGSTVPEKPADSAALEYHKFRDYLERIAREFACPPADALEKLIETAEIEPGIAAELRAACADTFR